MCTTGDLHVIRNAGGRVDESAIRSLVISQRLLGTKEVYIIHHTDCGAHTVEWVRVYVLTSGKSSWR